MEKIHFVVLENLSLKTKICNYFSTSLAFVGCQDSNAEKRNNDFFFEKTSSNKKGWLGPFYKERRKEESSVEGELQNCMSRYVSIVSTFQLIRELSFRGNKIIILLFNSPPQVESYRLKSWFKKSVWWFLHNYAFENHGKQICVNINRTFGFFGLSGFDCKKCWFFQKVVLK